MGSYLLDKFDLGGGYWGDLRPPLVAGTTPTFRRLLAADDGGTEEMHLADLD
jgi:hypothetical protein